MATVNPTFCGRIPTGRRRLWEMTGTNVIGGGAVGGNPGPSWQVKGSGDLNGDLPDIRGRTPAGRRRSGSRTDECDRRRRGWRQSRAELASLRRVEHFPGRRRCGGARRLPARRPASGQAICLPSSRRGPIGATASRTLLPQNTSSQIDVWEMNGAIAIGPA
jgi:hypothetical protein